jgi:hypothetical protein
VRTAPSYCGGQDILNLALPIPSLQPLRDGQIVAVCAAASDVADGYFVGRWGRGSVPLLTWDDSVTEATAKLSAFRLMRLRGINQKSPDWVVYEGIRKEAEDWFDKVQRQQAHPNVTLANAALPGQQQPKIVTSSVVDLSTGRMQRNRGW